MYQPLCETIAKAAIAAVSARRMSGPSVTLVQAPNVAPKVSIVDQLARLGVKPEQVKYVGISHYHADHFYGLQAFKQAGAEIWAHRRVQGYLAGDGPRTRLAERQQSLAPWVPRDMPLLAPDRYLDRDESFTLGDASQDTLRAIWNGPGYQAFRDALTYAQHTDVVVVVAAGHDANKTSAGPRHSSSACNARTPSAGGINSMPRAE